MQSVGEDVEHQNSRPLLVGMQNGIVIWKNSLAVLYKVEHRQEDGRGE